MKKIDQLILMAGIALLIFSIGKQINIKPPIHIPDIPVIIPDNIIPPIPVIPNLDKNILYDDYTKALELSKIHKRPLILIVSASWCSYCKDLRKDVDSIKQFNKTIVCFIDAEINKNKKLIEEYNIKGLPTSIILVDGIETARRNGYKRSAYEKWLDENL